MYVVSYEYGIFYVKKSVSFFYLYSIKRKLTTM